MTSTRNKNTPENYALEQLSYNKSDIWQTEYYRCMPSQTYFPGDGLLSGKMYVKQLSDNYCDIESMLRGIGSVNLVSPQAPIEPQIKEIQSLNICTKVPLLIPANLVVQPNQRPLFN
jgi:hypothetical protein